MADRFRAYGPDGSVVLAGNVVGDSLSLDGEAPVALVVFYAGPVDAEAVVGSVQLDPNPQYRAIEIKLSDLG